MREPGEGIPEALPRRRGSIDDEVFFHKLKPLFRWNQKILNLTILGLVFALGMWLLVWRPVGYRFSLIPGTYSDTRLILYTLEHVFRWFGGQEASLWHAGFYYPFPLTLAFSDNLVGVAPFYALFRWAGLDRESALQGWLMLGFALNYAAAAWSLRRLKFGALPAALGAFFFSFGLPMLAQVIHLQLLYRLWVPLAATLLWRFAEDARLWRLALVAVLLLWQALASIYLAVFLGLLLAAQALALAIWPPEIERAGAAGRLAFWPRRLQKAWRQAGAGQRGLALAGLALLAIGLAALLWPYREVTRLYGFGRTWDEVASMLPAPQSFLIADHAGYWRSISKLMQGVVMRHEHQLFIGLTPLALTTGAAIAGLAGRLAAPRRQLALLHLGVVLALLVLTVQIGEFSLYRLLWALPGMDSLRSLTRVVLVMMWPAAVLLACASEGLLGWVSGWNNTRKSGPARIANSAHLLPGWLAPALLGMALFGALLADSASFTYRQKFPKRHAQARLAELRAQLPAQLPAEPILFVGMQGDEDEAVAELDGMLLAQEYGWPTLNGYSGNAPPGYGLPDTCRELPNRILQYLAFAEISDPAAYHALMQRVVPVGFDDCDPAWWDRATSQRDNRIQLRT